MPGQAPVWWYYYYYNMASGWVDSRHKRGLQHRLRASCADPEKPENTSTIFHCSHRWFGGQQGKKVTGGIMFWCFNPQPINGSYNPLKTSMIDQPGKVSSHKISFIFCGCWLYVVAMVVLWNTVVLGREKRMMFYKPGGRWRPKSWWPLPRCHSTCNRRRRTLRESLQDSESGWSANALREHCRSAVLIELNSHFDLVICLSLASKGNRESQPGRVAMF